jgi:hypothetical protein
VRSRELRGKAVSRQAFAIFRKIAEVDEIMNSAVQERVLEVHPEVCFRHIARRPLEHGKKTREGYDERRNVLKMALPCAVPARDEVPHLGLGAQPDDLLDAAIAAVAADRGLRGAADRLPREPEFDARGTLSRFFSSILGDFSVVIRLNFRVADNPSTIVLCGTHVCPLLARRAVLATPLIVPSSPALWKGRPIVIEGSNRVRLVFRRT